MLDKTSPLCMVLSIVLILLCVIYLALMIYMARHREKQNDVKLWVLKFVMALTVTGLSFLTSGFGFGTVLWLALTILILAECIATYITEHIKRKPLEKTMRLRKTWLRQLTRYTEICLVGARTEGEFVIMSSFIEFLKHTLRDENGTFFLIEGKPSYAKEKRDTNESDSVTEDRH